MNKVTKRLLVACVAALAVGGCQDSPVFNVPPAPEPPPPPPPPPPDRTPSIQIQRITNVAGAVINPAAVAGQINIVLNVDPGSGNTLQEVRVLIDGEVVGKQTFSGNVSPRNAGKISANVAANTEIAVPYDTRFPNEQGNRYRNTSHTVTAQMDHSGGTASAAELTITTVNANIVNPTTGISFDGNNAEGPSPASNRWYGNGDITATCSVIMFDPPPSTFRLRTDDNGGTGTVVWADGDVSNRQSTTQAADLTVTASDIATKSRNTTVSQPETITCELPSTTNGWDTDGDGVLNVAGALDITRTLRLDNVPPMKPALGADYRFRDARNTASQAMYPANGWANNSTTFGVTGALDGNGSTTGIGTVVAALAKVTFDGFNGRWVLGAAAASGADLTDGGPHALGPSSMADGLGNAVTFVTADFTTCAVCSLVANVPVVGVGAAENGFYKDGVAPTFSNVRPTSGVPFLNANLAGAVDVVSDFSWTDDRSGIDWTSANTSRASQQTGFTVRDDGVAVGVTIAPVPADAEAKNTAVAHDLVYAGAGGGTLDGSVITASGQVADLAGNVTQYPGTSTTLDNTAPLVSLGTPTLPGSINAPNVQSIPLTFSGSVTDAVSGVQSITSAGFLDPDNPTNCTNLNETAFTSAFADKPTETLTSPAWTSNYTIFRNGFGAGVQQSYCINVLAKDNALFLSGSAMGNNVSTPVFQGTLVTW